MEMSDSLRPDKSNEKDIFGILPVWIELS